MRTSRSISCITVIAIVSILTSAAAVETPKKALDLVRDYENQKASAYLTVEESLTAPWTKLMTGLKALQMECSRKGRLDDAIAVRNEMKRLYAERGDRLLATAGNRSGSGIAKNIASLVEQMSLEGFLEDALALRDRYEAVRAEGEDAKKGVPIVDDPGSPGQYDRGPGTSVYVRVTGRTSGAGIWGTDVYTSDSSLAMAAVHAGALRAGETGIVKVTFQQGQPSYQGSIRNGVSTGSWGAYGSCFRLKRFKP